MKKDLDEICEIISDMLDDSDENGVFHTSTAYRRLEFYIESERTQAIGWAHTNACIALDKGDDPRLAEIPEILARARKDLS